MAEGRDSNADSRLDVSEITVDSEAVKGNLKSENTILPTSTTTIETKKIKSDSAQQTTTVGTESSIRKKSVILEHKKSTIRDASRNFISLIESGKSLTHTASEKSSGHGSSRRSVLVHDGSRKSVSHGKSRILSSQEASKKSEAHESSRKSVGLSTSRKSLIQSSTNIDKKSETHRKSVTAMSSRKSLVTGVDQKSSATITAPRKSIVGLPSRKSLEDLSTVVDQKLIKEKADEKQTETDSEMTEPYDGVDVGQVLSEAFLDTESLKDIHRKIKLVQQSPSKSNVLLLKGIDEPHEFSEHEYEDVRVEQRRRRVTLVSEDFELCKRKRRRRRKSQRSSRGSSLRTSIFSRSLKYDLFERFGNSIRETRLSGDFRMNFARIEGLASITLEEPSEEEEEEYEEEEEEQTTCFDRKTYYKKYEALHRDLKIAQILNTLLHRRMAVYYRNRAMLHVLKEDVTSAFSINKYNLLLEKYSSLCDQFKRQRDNDNRLIDYLKKRKNDIDARLQLIFRAFQERENNIGLGLIYSKTGITISDKLVERLINRQKLAMDSIAKMTLTWLRLKSIVAAEEEQIKQFDKIDDTHYLQDYEKIKAENMMHMDKIEDKEEELARVRNKSKETIQIIAHLREKIDAMDDDLQELNSQSTYVGFLLDDERARLNNSKREKDKYRQLIAKLKQESGLLTRTNLLKDMEHAIEDAELMKKELKELQEESKLKSKQIKHLRKKLEQTCDIVTKKRNTASVHLHWKPKIRKEPIYNRKPSSFDITLPSTLFHLSKTEFQPRVTKIIFDV